MKFIFANIILEGNKAEKPVTHSPTQPIQTKPVEKQKKIPDIQPSKTHKGDTNVGTKKETKIVVHSVVEQNVVKNSADNLLPKREVNK